MTMPLISLPISGTIVVTGCPSTSVVLMGLYTFDGSQSFTGNPPNEIPASSLLFNYIWMTANDTLYNQDNIIDYQYQSNSIFSGNEDPLLYDICLRLIDINSPFGCYSDTCINPGLYVEYWKTLNMPNSLSPNSGSSEAQYFLPKGRSIDKGSYKIQIFDIWVTREFCFYTINL